MLIDWRQGPVLGAMLCGDALLCGPHCPNGQVQESPDQHNWPAR